jgi:hypothetical protein
VVVGKGRERRGTCFDMPQSHGGPRFWRGKVEQWHRGTVAPWLHESWKPSGLGSDGGPGGDPGGGGPGSGGPGGGGPALHSTVRTQ